MTDRQLHRVLTAEGLSKVILVESRPLGPLTC